MEKGGWKYFGEYEIEGVMQFWNVLEKLSTLDRDARGCKGGCGSSNCEIRKCAQERNIITCAFCPDFPCELVEELDRKYPIVIENLKKQKEIGTDKWIEEQENLYSSGFCYNDIVKIDEIS